MDFLLETVKQEYEFDCFSRGHSKATMAAYQTALRQFCEFAALNGVANISDVKTPLLRAYAAEIMRHLKPGGAHARLRVLRSFLRWATAEEYFDKCPMDRVTLPKLPQTMLDAVSPQDMKKLLYAAQSSSTPLKYQAMLAVLYDTGLRVSELWRLEIRDLLPNQCLMIREAKGGEDRVVPASRATLKLINAYLRSERPESGLPEIFLVHQDGPYSNVSVYKLLERLCQRARIKRYSPHAFRRGFAVNYIRNGGDVFTLQRILGHSTLTMTNRYASLNTQDIQDVHRRVSPMSALR